MVLCEVSLLVFSSKVQEPEQFTLQTGLVAETFLTLSPFKNCSHTSYLVSGSEKHPQMWYIFSSESRDLPALELRDKSLKTRTVFNLLELYWAKRKLNFKKNIKMIKSVVFHFHYNRNAKSNCPWHMLTIWSPLICNMSFNADQIIRKQN